MWQLLIGGGIGAAGIVLALWWRYGLAKLEAVNVGLRADIKSLKRDVTDRDKQLAVSTKTLIDEVERHNDFKKRSDQELAVWKLRVEKQNALLRDCNDPDAVAARIGMLFPMPKAPTDGGGNQDGDGGG